MYGVDLGQPRSIKKNLNLVSEQQEIQTEKHIMYQITLHIMIGKKGLLVGKKE